jgi:endonuclease-3
MQMMFSLGQTAELRAIRDRLRRHFGPVKEEPRLDPVSRFVRSFLGSRNRDASSWAAFHRLRQRFESWDEMADAPVAEIEAELQDVAFAEKKAPDLKRALEKIRVRAGALNLDFLGTLDVDAALVWLEQIHGVGRKIAASTLNFSTLRRRAFVADSHVIRVLQRFGFVTKNATTEAVYDAVMLAAGDCDAGDLYQLHWHLKRLGRQICTHQRAHCALCPLSELCLQRINAQPARGAGVRQPSLAL